MLNEFEVVMADDSETVYPGDTVVLDETDVDAITSANLASAYLELAHLIDLDLEWVKDNIDTVDRVSLEDTLIRSEDNIDDLTTLALTMEYMGYEVPVYESEYIDECPVCGWIHQ